ncbi:unnamed protein product [Didymodactylos carnosus]|uniref:ADP ribosyltransferase domain-containing protein n=1 Tax=Didymodactylos carnosus TaxID=1234261 RepID=A0A8S2EKA2_9BILA|nr:unnamed protein product [Didymodactylos carnosus]CAF3978502.1 unnamed protein product [Didymodactylos carnosus]
MPNLSLRILEEGKLLNEESEAQLIADKLRHVKDKSVKEIYDCCIRLYSAESFLYKLVNSTLRSEDMTKTDTLGAYCQLLSWHLGCSELDQKELTVYRGCKLTEELIEEYTQNVGKRIQWLAFTSTTKDRKVAEGYGNTLFIINLQRCQPYGKQRDIASLSQYEHEQEVLLNAGNNLGIVKFERNLESGKYLIYLKENV